MIDIKVLSLFDGMACGMIALERAGISVEEYDAYEIDKYAIEVSHSNYPQINHKGNVFDAVYQGGNTIC
jgi:DNA (cytosine-5)-methyltransferase 3A